MTAWGLVELVLPKFFESGGKDAPLRQTGRLPLRQSSK
jgi:hypothetical protein